MMVLGAGQKVLHNIKQKKLFRTGLVRTQCFFPHQSLTLYTYSVVKFLYREGNLKADLFCIINLLADSSKWLLYGIDPLPYLFTYRLYQFDDHSLIIYHSICSIRKIRKKTPFKLCKKHHSSLKHKRDALKLHFLGQRCQSVMKLLPIPIAYFKGRSVKGQSNLNPLGFKSF